MVRWLLVLPVLVACQDKEDEGESASRDSGTPPIDDPEIDDDPEEEVLPGVGGLGNETHSIEEVTVTVIGDSDDGLDVPRDLAFNTGVDNELWVVNRADDSTVTYRGVGTDDQDATHIRDPAANHFMEEVSSIAFGAAVYTGSTYLNFGSCQESRNTYDDWYDPNDFMGPSLWSSDPDIYGETFPDAVAHVAEVFDIPEAYANLGSHLDMLHQSPLCMGIAWETENVYWVFNGMNGSIDRNDFVVDHGPGYDDHNDGIIQRHVEGEVSRVEDVPSHMVIDPATALLYIADTGNNAIKVLDTTSGSEGSSLWGMEPSVSYHEWDETLIWTLVEGDDFDIEQPSGLELVDDTLLVTDHATGIIHAFDLDGNQIDYLDTELGDGALMGIAARSLEDLWIVDAKDDRVLRIQP